jgi:hypothetical protein
MHKDFARKNVSHDYWAHDGLMSPSMMTSVQQYSHIGKPETANTSHNQLILNLNTPRLLGTAASRDVTNSSVYSSGSPR